MSAFPKNLEWEVSLRSGELLYRERGKSPHEALANLKDAMRVGIAHAEENIAVHERRLTGITAYLAELEEKA